jgi:hypothetical protein
LPRFAELWLLYLLYGVLGGIAFGLQGFFAGAYGVSGHDSVQRLAAYPIESQVVLWLAGPAFPFALLVLAVVYQLVPGLPDRPSTLVVVMLGLAAVAFPVSRIPRAEWLAHPDALMVAAFALLAWQRIRGQPPGDAVR